MPQRLYATLILELPEHPQQLAAAVADVSTAWAKLLADIGLECEARLEIQEHRKEVRKQGKRATSLAAVPNAAA